MFTIYFLQTLQVPPSFAHFLQPVQFLQAVQFLPPEQARPPEYTVKAKRTDNAIIVSFLFIRMLLLKKLISF